MATITRQDKDYLCVQVTINSGMSQSESFDTQGYALMAVGFPSVWGTSGSTTTFSVLVSGDNVNFFQSTVIGNLSGVAQNFKFLNSAGGLVGVIKMPWIMIQSGTLVSPGNQNATCQIMVLLVRHNCFGG